MPNGSTAGGPVRHLRAVGGAPRPAGGPAEAATRDYAAGVLRAAGYAVDEVPFAYSDAPGRLGTPMGGVWVAATIALAAAAGASGRVGLATVVVTAGGLTLVAVGAWIGRFGVVRLRWRRHAGVNLVATRGGVGGGDPARGNCRGRGCRCGSSRISTRSRSPCRWSRALAGSSRRW